MVLAKKSQSLDIFRLVKDIDPNAFISQSNVVGAVSYTHLELKDRKPLPSVPAPRTYKDLGVE